ncbi:MAG: preprotein translocase subunit SecY [Butyrivibrio sp.]|nr:preprotein translocase subunit SecY [Butyrivibrio sp.]
MFKSLVNAFRVKEIRLKLLFTLLMLVLIRVGCNLPIPGVRADALADMFSGSDFSFINAVTGGSLLNLSVFALNISPYITASIIMQLLTIAIPKLEEMQKDGEDGRKKIASITRYVTIGLSLVEGVAMVYGFRNQNIISGYAAMSTARRIFSGAVMVAALTAGSALLMWIGERITEKGVGNGISIVLVINIISRIPADFMSLYQTFIKGQSVLAATAAVVIIAAVIVGVVVLTVLLCTGERRIPVQYSKKIQGRRTYGGQSSHIPLKVNTAGVIPVIFAQSLMTFPAMIARFFDVDYSTFGGKVLLALSSGNWFNRSNMIYTVGVIVYIALNIFFAYFYTSITFNPIEIANNMKKSGGFIPGIRPGKPTSDYLTKILNKMIFIGAIGLVIVAIIPIICSGLFNADVSFGGTSLIIIVGVVLETIRQIESQMVVRDYKGFLN